MSELEAELADMEVCTTEPTKIDRSLDKESKHPSKQYR